MMIIWRGRIHLLILILDSLFIFHRFSSTPPLCVSPSKGVFTWSPKISLLLEAFLSLIAITMYLLCKWMSAYIYLTVQWWIANYFVEFLSKIIIIGSCSVRNAVALLLLLVLLLQVHVCIYCKVAQEKKRSLSRNVLFFFFFFSQGIEKELIRRVILKTRLWWRKEDSLVAPPVHGTGWDATGRQDPVKRVISYSRRSLSPSSYRWSIFS